jgi:hypothetical protein
MEETSIILKDLPKVSLNKWYAGIHWTKRNETKNNYKLIVRSQFKKVFPKDMSYECEYIFHWKKNPLDTSNCVAMVKLIEDVLFEDDKHDIVPKITIQSKKAKEEFVEINIKEICRIVQRVPAKKKSKQRSLF